jgi:hypothetical protein
MRITVRGWGRDVGETEVMSAPLLDAESPSGSYSRGTLYKTVEYPDHRRMTKVRVSTSTELRLGGTYLLHVELSRAEIAQLFFDTHSGDVVRMFRSFMEDEARAEHARWLERLAQHDERRRQRLAEKEHTQEPEENEKSE